MTRKEIKNLAKKIAKVEKQLQGVTDLKEKSLLETQLMELCSKAQSLEDMVLIDDMVQEIMEQDS